MSLPTRTTSDFCPHCDYALVGLPMSVMVCPECQGSLTLAAYAKVAARRMARSHSARISLWASPAIAFGGSLPIMMFHQGGVIAGTYILLCMWAGGALAVYHSAKTRPGDSGGRVVKALLIGLPLGIVYLLFVFATAFGMALLLGWLMN